METKDLIINYVNALPKAKRDDTIRAILNQWEIDRCAEAEEYISDKENDIDIYLITETYGCTGTIAVLNDRNRYFAIGTNFPKPEPIEDIYETFMGLLADIADMYEQFPENYEPMIPASEMLKMIFNRENE